MAAKALYFASLGDGTEALMVTELPVRLRHDKAGILIGRPEAPSPGATSDHRSAAVVAASSRVEWIAIQPHELTRTAVATARLVHIAFVTICPAGVSPARTGLACAVAEVLRLQREPGCPIVMCAEVPSLGLTRTAIPHEVTVTDESGASHVRHVWEIVRHEDIPAWMTALRTRPVAA